MRRAHGPVEARSYCAPAQPCLGRKYRRISPPCGPSCAVATFPVASQLSAKNAPGISQLATRPPLLVLRPQRPRSSRRITLSGLAGGLSSKCCARSGDTRPCGCHNRGRRGINAPAQSRSDASACANARFEGGVYPAQTRDHPPAQLHRPFNMTCVPSRGHTFAAILDHMRPRRFR